MTDILSWSGDMPDLPSALEIANAKWPEQMHLRAGENLPLCVAAGEARFTNVWGQHLTDDPKEVGCPGCVEWVHG